LFVAPSEEVHLREIHLLLSTVVVSGTLVALKLLVVKFTAELNNATALVLIQSAAVQEDL
jgi:hypothetical protein